MRSSRTIACRAVISRLGLDPDARFESLSSGMKRRVLLGEGTGYRARHSAAG